MKHLARIMIAAPASGSGKTLVTIGLLQYLKEQGIHATAFKCGPDYIDPMFHKKVLQLESRNLDTFFSEEKEILAQLGMAEEIAVMEGVMGLYDGLGGLREEGSAYHLACTSGTPILLVVNAAGMGRTIVSLLKGLKLDDSRGLIRGVILNQTSRSFYQTIAPVIEAETGIRPLGYIPKMKGFSLSSRHLGLMMPEEIRDFEARVRFLSETLASSLDPAGILSLAEEAEDFAWEAPAKAPLQKRLRLAVARDEAFCFYYQANLEMLTQRGIEIVEFSPLHDHRLPEQIDGILLGGGYPELALPALAANEKMRQEIRSRLEEGLPSLAECGGFMYLHEAILDEEGKAWEMVGAIEGSCHNTGKLCRFGYVNVELENPKLTVRGHEFHYYDSSNNGNAASIRKPVSGRSWQGMHRREGSLWGYPHLYYPSCPQLVDWFAEEMQRYHQRGIRPL